MSREHDKLVYQASVKAAKKQEKRNIERNGYHPTANKVCLANYLKN